MANIKYYNLVAFFTRGKNMAAACAAASTKALTNEKRTALPGRG